MQDSDNNRLRRISFAVFFSLLSGLFLSNYDSSNYYFDFRYGYNFPVSALMVDDVETSMKLAFLNALRSDTVPDLSLIRSSHGRNKYPLSDSEVNSTGVDIQMRRLYDKKNEIITTGVLDSNDSKNDGKKRIRSH